MAATPTPVPSKAPTRLHHSDPATDLIFQDLYDKLNQISKVLAKLLAAK